MRAELAAAVAGVIAGMNPEPITVTDEEIERLLAAADLVTLARTGVEYDYRGDVIDAHAPEMPTPGSPSSSPRSSVERVAVGMDRDDAMRLAIRCARDSMPPMRLAIIDDLAGHPDSMPTEVRKRLGKPRTTVDRQLQALHILGVVDLREEEEEPGEWRGGVTWHYSLAKGIDPDALSVQVVPFPEMSLHTPNPTKRSQEGRGEEREREEGSQVCTDISGNGTTCTDGNSHPQKSTTVSRESLRERLKRAATLTQPDQTDREAANAAYVKGLCKTCHTVPYRPGGTQCEDCFQADRNALNLLGEHLGAKPVDEADS